MATDTSTPSPLRFQGRPILGGVGRGPLLMTEAAMNFTAAFTKPHNLIPGRRAEVRDRHHPWFKTSLSGRVIVIPTAIGSTHTGLVLLDLARMKRGPAAILVDQADSLMVSGIILSEVWYGPGIPVVEIPTAELRARLHDGEVVTVDGGTGEVTVERGRGGSVQKSSS